MAQQRGPETERKRKRTDEDDLRSLRVDVGSESTSDRIEALTPRTETIEMPLFLEILKRVSGANATPDSKRYMEARTKKYFELWQEFRQIEKRHVHSAHVSFESAKQEYRRARETGKSDEELETILNDSNIIGTKNIEEAKSLLKEFAESLKKENKNTQ